MFISSANVSVDWLNGHSKFHSLADERLYYDEKWRERIAFANHHNLSPKQSKALALAGISFQFSL